MHYRLGFTGTQVGMTNEQKDSLRNLLNELNVCEAHHGDCVGADAEFHDIVEKLNIPIYIHPPIINHKRAYKNAEFIFAPTDYMERNWDIVNSCDMLIATPKDYTEKQRSGTWSTVRKARKKSRLIYIILPNGKIRREK